VSFMHRRPEIVSSLFGIYAVRCLSIGSEFLRCSPLFFFHSSRCTSSWQLPLRYLYYILYRGFEAFDVLRNSFVVNHDTQIIIIIIRQGKYFKSFTRTLNHGAPQPRSNTCPLREAHVNLLHGPAVVPEIRVFSRGLSYPSFSSYDLDTRIMQRLSASFASNSIYSQHFKIVTSAASASFSST